MLAALLTDFGLDDLYVGVMKAVLLGVCPAARIIDLTHAIPPQDVAAGALALADALPYLPAGAVVVAVVDPGVGSDRAALAAQVDGRYVLGPDNGLLSWCLGPSAAVVRLAEPRYWRERVSRTFHGRDVFAPVAGHLLNGEPLAVFGPSVATWVGLARPTPRRRHDGTIEAHVVAVDRFGNVILDLTAAELPREPTFQVGGLMIRGVASTYANAGGQPAALAGSFGRIEIALPGGSAAATLDLGRGAVVLVRPGRTG
jgi:S-adenosylmethionine hydrolase